MEWRKKIFFIAGIIMLVAVFVLATGFVRAVKTFKKDRLNVLFYSEKPVFFSLGVREGVHYRGVFTDDVLLQVPGGYGRYRAGALGKLSQIEKDETIIQRAFSAAVSSYVDFYFYPKSSIIYFDQSDKNSRISILTLVRTIFSRQHITNTNLWDRIFLFASFMSTRKNSFIDLPIDQFTQQDEQLTFDDRAFAKKHQGFFYQKSIREEEENVEIVYGESYEAAEFISRILEGEGMHVVDIATDDLPKTCIINEDISSQISRTAYYLAHMFDCEVRQQKQNGSGIVIRLDAGVEKLWK